MIIPRVRPGVGLFLLLLVIETAGLAAAAAWVVYLVW